MTQSNFYFTGKETTVENIIQELAICSNGRIQRAPPVMVDNTQKARTEVVG